MNSNNNKCIICDERADAKGSHIIPANLLKSGIGERNREEIYMINATKSTVESYFGRENPKNTSTEINRNFYVRDYILCQKCEKELSKLESSFSQEFLNKFRDEKYRQNFKIEVYDDNIKVFTPKRIDKNKIYAFLYSVIYRYCMDSGIYENDYCIKNDELEKIKSYLKEYIYGDSEIANKYIEEFGLVILFNEEIRNDNFVGEKIENNKPYLFLFNEVILVLLNNDVDKKGKFLFDKVENSIISENEIKIIVDNKCFNVFLKLHKDYVSKNYVFNEINKLCLLNGKSFQENNLELIEEINKVDDSEEPAFRKACKILENKYSK
ncbi:hypothetical protein OL230_06720 [Capnocytophaga ochracea]|uniref:hypothetical protein n=1 Tax=Capnocytophaga ochracea TaxID=1018 RepID=UPI002231A2C2|nr:hypothetical protein [Capnocytophaga ochracea]UZD37553.1 hypothetical protein OL230_06720 [Capnocytophaga ochracea]